MLVAQKNPDFKVPDPQLILGALRKKPSECSEDQTNAVEFLMNVALPATNSILKLTRQWQTYGTHQKILGANWAHTFASGVLLMEEFSDMENITHNLTQQAKKRRKRMKTKASDSRRFDSFYKWGKDFLKLSKEEGSSQRLAEWDQLCSKKKEAEELGKKVTARDPIVPQSKLGSSSSEEGSGEADMQEFLSEMGCFPDCSSEDSSTELPPLRPSVTPCNI